MTRKMGEYKYIFSSKLGHSGVWAVSSNEEYARQILANKLNISKSDLILENKEKNWRARYYNGKIINM